MAYNEQLADRVREELGERDDIAEKRMMGGLVFMCDDKMLVCVKDDDLMVRLDPRDAAEAHEENGVRPVSMGTKKMNGWVFVGQDVLRKPAELRGWLQRALAYNPQAKRSARRAER